MNWEYLAGLFDGEGSITVTQNNWGNVYVKVCIAQANAPFLHLVRGFLGYGEVNEQTGIKKAKTTSYTLDISRKDEVHRFLSQISPYLILRKVEAELTLPLVCESFQGRAFTDEQRLEQLSRVAEIKEAASTRRRGVIPQKGEVN